MKVCTKCKIEKNEDEFRFRDKKKGTRQCWCKVCFSIYEREKWKSSIDRRDGNKNKLYERRKRNRQFIWDYLKNSSCEECGESDTVVLTFNHLDRESKRFQLSDCSNLTFSLKTIEEEIKKCNILCANCHMRHTAIQLGWYKSINK